MTDHELLELELAAKAAGVTHPDVLKKHLASGWNPHIDDGDALRLAVKLGILLATREGRPIGESEPDFHDDPYAATRRAIVRAAAEIGRNMK